MSAVRSSTSSLMRAPQYIKLRYALRQGNQRLSGLFLHDINRTQTVVHAHEQRSHSQHQRHTVGYCCGRATPKEGEMSMGTVLSSTTAAVTQGCACCTPITMHAACCRHHLGVANTSAACHTLHCR